MKIDLHLHSTASDGRLSPKEIIDLALQKKIPAIAITDHDTIEGNKEALEYAKGKDIEFVPGIEITITPPRTCKELHVVGLFIDSEDKEFNDLKKRHLIYSENTAKKIIKKLNNLGYKITFEELLEETNGEHLGRPWLAKILMRKYPEEFKERIRFLEKEGINVKVINIINPKKLDPTFKDKLEANVPVLTLYNGNPFVLQSAVATSVMGSEGAKPSKIYSHGFEFGISGQLEDLLTHFGYDVQSIKHKVHKILK